MIVTATEAKNRFGYVLSQCKRKPVSVEKNGRVEAILISAEHYAELQIPLQAATSNNLALRQASFNETYKEWFAVQNEMTERHGVFGEEWRTW